MQLLNTEYWVNATVERHPPPGQGIPQKRFHVLLERDAKQEEKKYGNTILPALGVTHMYAVRTPAAGEQKLRVRPTAYPPRGDEGPGPLGGGQSAGSSPQVAAPGFSAGFHGAKRGEAGSAGRRSDKHETRRR